MTPVLVDANVLIDISFDILINILIDIDKHLIRGLKNSFFCIFVSKMGFFF